MQIVNVVLMMSVLAMTACVNTGGSVSENTICTELRKELFDMQKADTEVSKLAYADFLDVYHGQCGK